MKILLFDIETAPVQAYVWGLYNEVTSMAMVEKDWYCLCWCAKWLDSKEMITGSLHESKSYKKDPENDKEIMVKLWKLLDEADVVIAHNAVKFDVRKVNARFLQHDLTPPSPYKVIDTLQAARRYFKFTSNRLGDLGVFLKVGKKIDTGGFELWKGCLRGDKKSWNHMVKYCKQDVTLLQKVYLKMRPYITNHPNRALPFLEENPCCPDCGSFKIRKQGTRRHVGSINNRYRCGSCARRFSLKIKDIPLQEKIFTDRPLCPKCGRNKLTVNKTSRTTSGIVTTYKCTHCGGYSNIKIRNWTKEERANILKNA